MNRALRRLPLLGPLSGRPLPTGFGACACLVLAVGAAGCEKPAAGPAEVPPRSVDVVVVGVGDAVREVSVVGSLEGEHEVQVTSPMPERIVSLRVREGERVPRGKVLAVLASDLQSEGIKQAEAGLATAEANRDALVQEVERVRKLVAAQAAPTSQLVTLEAQLRTAEAQVRQTATSISAASAQQRRSIITAPISGVVANLRVREGDTANPAMPLMMIVEGSRVKAVLQLPEREFLQIEVGMPVRLAALGSPERVVEGKVSLVGPVVDRRTRTGVVEVALDNEGGVLVPGSAVKSRIEVERREGVVLVPAHAVLLTADTERTGEALVFVVEGDVAKRKEVVIGQRQGALLEIRSGLQPGERLVVRGQHLLRDGSAVEVLGSQQEKRAAGAASRAPAGAVEPAAEAASANEAPATKKAGDGA